MGRIDLEIDLSRQSRQEQIEIAPSTHYGPAEDGRSKRMSRMKSISIPKVDEQLSTYTSPSIHRNSMDNELYNAATKGDTDDFISALERISAAKKLPLTTILDHQLSPQQNTVLHFAAGSGHEDLSGFITEHFSYLVGKTNHKGDTPLHLAARAGHLGVVETLVRVGLSESGIREGNKDGNTPLHEAMMNHHHLEVELLLTSHPEGAYYVNNEGKSPLYLAVEDGDIENVKAILNSAPNVVDELLTKGKPLIHAAILRRNQVLLQEMVKIKPALIYFKDENGQNPLHCAASIGFLDGVRLILREFSLDTFQGDKDGSYPIHIASKNGHIGIIQEFLQHFPYTKECLNEKGHNILHVAAKNGKDNVVKYILKTPGLELLINERDNDGNTPLHLATINWHPKVLSSLTWDARLNVKLLSNEGLTALEVAEEYMESTPSYRKRLTWTVLKSAGVPRAKLGNKAKLSRLKSIKNESYSMDYYKDRINTLLLVSTLVATVTFAAGFTMPGGFNSSEPNQGMATMLRKHLFPIFVICDTIAFYSSIIVVVTLIWAQLGDLHLVLNALKLALPLLGVSLTMMSLAFTVSVHLVVSKVIWLASVVLIMGFVSISCLLALYLPYISNFRVSHYTSYYALSLLMLVSGSYDDHELDE